MKAYVDKLNKRHATITITENCNLACVYCYEKYKSKRKMDLNTALKAINEILTEENFDESVIEFFGGEPFLEFGLIQEVCEYVWMREWRKPFLFFATTNGTLIHGNIQRWLEKNSKRFYVGLSLDGTQEIHDLNRSKSYSRIDIDFFRKCWPDQSVKMTVSRESLCSLAESVMYLHFLGFEIKNNFAYGLDWSSTENINILVRELNKLIDFYLANPKIKPCSLLSMEIERLAVNVNEIHKWCGVGTSMVAYDVDGEKYPCQLFMPVSIGKEKASLAYQLDFSLPDSLRDSMCEGCLLLPICPTCYGVNYELKNNIAIRDKDLCGLTKVRALACSYFKAQQILHREPHARTAEDAVIIEAIRAIQDQIKI